MEGPSLWNDQALVKFFFFFFLRMLGRINIKYVYWISGMMLTINIILTLVCLTFGSFRTMFNLQSTYP